MPKPRNLIFDFDSTLISVESLEELAALSLAHRPDRLEVLEEIKVITNQGMDGVIPFPESLSRRLKIMNANTQLLQAVAAGLLEKITPSALEHLDFFRQWRDTIYVITGGFYDLTAPVIERLGLRTDRIYCNRFLTDAAGAIIGADPASPLAQPRGKVKQALALGLASPTVIVGDGHTDYEIREAGAAQTFVAFTENIHRAPVVEKADVVVQNFGELAEWLEHDSL